MFDNWQIKAAAVLFALAIGGSANGSEYELFLTAQVEPTPGLEGYFTYNITATSNAGIIRGWDFGGHANSDADWGIFGQLNQLPGTLLFQDSFSDGLLELGSFDRRQDSYFKVASDEVLSLARIEKPSAMHGISAFVGQRADLGNRLQFLQLVTNDPSSVRLTGELLTMFDSRTHGHEINTLLSNIPIQQAPSIEIVPLPAPPIVLPPPQVLPPPVVAPPVAAPVPYQQPYIPPRVEVPQPPIAPAPAEAPFDFALTAEVQPTTGMEGYFTYTITATSEAGVIRGFDFGGHPNSGTSKGVSGPLQQLPGETVFQDSFSDESLAVEDFDRARDSHFLVKSDEVVSLSRLESADSLHAIAAFIGERPDLTNQLAFLQLVTNDAAAVQLTGQILADFQGRQTIHEVSVSLADIAIGAAPTIDIRPITSYAPTVPTAPELPPVASAPTETPEIPPVIDVVIDPPVPAPPLTDLPTEVVCIDTVYSRDINLSIDPVVLWSIVTSVDYDGPKLNVGRSPRVLDDAGAFTVGIGRTLRIASGGAVGGAMQVPEPAAGWIAALAMGALAVRRR